MASLSVSEMGMSRERRGEDGVICTKGIEVE